MLRFIGYLELIESKIDDLEKQNPTIPIRQYATHDKSPTKKFLPWLVKQHKLGNVTPDHPDLADTLGNFDKYKSKHGINDHTQHSFQEVADAVRPHIGTAATNKERQRQEIQSGVEVLHKEPNGITAQHIKTKEASQNMYGGGTNRGGEPGGARGTSWCVSARSKDCLFQHSNYGKMYTIHDPNDDNAPYAVHPEKGKITSRHNNGDKPIAAVLKEKPHLATAVDKIQDHYQETVSPREKLKLKLERRSGDITEDDITHVLTHENDQTDPDGSLRSAAIHHHKATVDHITHVLTHEKHNGIRMAAVSNPNATEEHITQILTHENERSDPVITLQVGNLRSMAINHPKANEEHITHVLTHENEKSDPFGIIRFGAITHPKSTVDHITHVLTHENEQSDRHGRIRDAALKNPKLNLDHLNHVLTHESYKSPSSRSSMNLTMLASQIKKNRYPETA